MTLKILKYQHLEINLKEESTSTAQWTCYLYRYKFCSTIFKELSSHLLFNVFRVDGEKDSDAFRSWYSKLFEIRSFLRKCTCNGPNCYSYSATFDVQKNVTDSLGLYQGFICYKIPMKNIKFHLLDSSTEDPEIFLHLIENLELKDAERVAYSDEHL